RCPGRGARRPPARGRAPWPGLRRRRDVRASAPPACSCILPARLRPRTPRACALRSQLAEVAERLLLEIDIRRMHGRQVERALVSRERRFLPAPLAVELREIELEEHQIRP